MEEYGGWVVFGFGHYMWMLSELITNDNESH